MTRGVLLFAAAFALLVPQDKPAAVTSIALSVTSRDGRFLGELQADQFEVEIDDKPVPIASCSEGDPVTAALLIDASGSMSFMRLENVVRELPDVFRPADVASVGWFGKAIVTGTTFSREPAMFDAAARDLAKSQHERYAPSPLWDALNAALTTLDAREGRRAVIVVSDGRASGDVIPYDIVLRHAMTSEISVSFLVPGMPRPGVDVKRPRGRGAAEVNDSDAIKPWERPERLALATGGTATPSATDVVRMQLRRLLQGLQAEYRLTLTPETHDNRLHPVRVRVKPPGLTVRAPEAIITR